MSASCSMAPDSLRSDNSGVLSALFFDVARQLRYQNDGTSNSLASSLPTADGGNLTLAGRIRVAGRGVEKLQVVDNDHTALAPAVHRLHCERIAPS